MGRCGFLGGMPGRARRSARGMAALPLVAPVASADSRRDGPRGSRSCLMPRIGPISRQDFIYYLRRMGFEGPYAGGRHQLMQKGLQTVRVPNPHRGDMGAGLLARILRNSGIDRIEWEKL